MPTTLSFVSSVRDLLGSPYHLHGAMPGVALDCIEMIRLAADDCGAATSHWEIPQGYAASYEGNEMGAFMDRNFTTVWKRTAEMRRAQYTQLFKTDMRNGDILCMGHGLQAQHPAVVAVGAYGWNIIHTRKDFGKAKEHRLDGKWLLMVVSVYRLPDVY